jgi:hypothetical protein
MERTSKLMAIAVMLLLFGQPLAACIMPGHTMTAAEHDCCMKMASMCESSAMPMSHSCCKHALSPQVIALSKMQNGDHAAIAVLICEVAPALPSSMLRRNTINSESPPGCPPALSTVLRI